MDNFDDLLNSIGINVNRPNEPPQTLPETIENQQEPPQSQFERPEQQQPVTELSQQDIDDVLSEYGFSPVEEAEGEEVQLEIDNEGQEEELEIFTPTRYIDIHLDNVPIINEEGDVDIEAQEMSENAEIAESDIRLSDEDIDAIIREAQEENPIEENTELPAEQSLIQPNSPTLLIEDATSRFSGAEWFNEIQRKRIILAGIGGIGSNLVFQLSRMSPENITIYDDDYVEAANMSGQLFSRSDVGGTKVAAIHNMILNYSPASNIYSISRKFTEDTEPGDIMMSGFDNMKARKTFFEAWYNHVMAKPEEKRKNCLLLDGRLSIDVAQVFCLTGDDSYNIDKYRKQYLFTDEEADETVCSLKQTTYMACLIASLMTNLFTNFVANLLNPLIPYDLPFFTEYDARNMIFNTQK